MKKKVIIPQTLQLQYITFSFPPENVGLNMSPCDFLTSFAFRVILILKDSLMSITF